MIGGMVGGWWVGCHFGDEKKAMGDSIDWLIFIAGRVLFLYRSGVGTEHHIKHSANVTTTTQMMVCMCDEDERIGRAAHMQLADNTSPPPRYESAQQCPNPTDKNRKFNRPSRPTEK